MIEQYTDITWTAVDKYTIYKSQDVESALPLTMLGDGEPLTDYKIYGNMTQSGTPTPSDPIYPSECGERTENLFDNPNDIDPYYIESTEGKYRSTISNSRTALIKCTAGNVYTISAYSRTFCVAFYSSRPINETSALTFYNYDYGVYGTHVQTVTAPENAQYIGFFCYNSGTEAQTYTENEIFSTVMIVAGSTAPTSYIPYGYRVPMYVRGENLWKFGNVSFNINDGTKSFTLDCPASSMFSFRFSGTKTGIIIIAAADENNTAHFYTFTNDNSQQIYKIRITHIITRINLYVGNTYADSKEHTGTYSDIMLNSGSTALPYQPYSRTDTPIYLGESQTTRQIKKLELTGEENWRIDDGRFTFKVTDIKSQGLRRTQFYCSSYQVISDGREYANVPNNAIYTGGGDSSGAIVYIHTDEYTTTTSFKAYLAQQYSNGTPVTIWYPLMTPTTGTLNEPLRKIGDYTDSVSGTGLPTLNGTTVYDADLVTKPSKMEAEADARWLPYVPKEYDNGAWK